MIESRFGELLVHSTLLLKKKWLFGILDDFVTKQLPHNVTWGLSLLYAVEHKGDRALTSTQGGICWIVLCSRIYYMYIYIHLGFGADCPYTDHTFSDELLLLKPSPNVLATKIRCFGLYMGSLLDLDHIYMS